MRKLLFAATLAATLSGSAVIGASPLANPNALLSAPDLSELSGNFQVDADTAIPGATLKSGSYTIRVVDRLSDRSILRVEEPDGKVLSTFLAVPNRSLTSSGGPGPVSWSGGSEGDRALRGFNFAGAYSVEFVYPKAEAVKIAVKHSAAVEAIDPSSDNLPSQQKNLTNDDMRIVTLWTLSPTRVNGNTAIVAEKYKPVEPAPAPQTNVAQNQEPADLPSASPVAAASPVARTSPTVAPAPIAPVHKVPKRHPIATALPHTASNLPIVLLSGILSLLGIVALRSRGLFTES